MAHLALKYFRIRTAKPKRLFKFEERHIHLP